MQEEEPTPAQAEQSMLGLAAQAALVVAQALVAAGVVLVDMEDVVATAVGVTTALQGSAALVGVALENPLPLTPAAAAVAAA